LQDIDPAAEHSNKSLDRASSDLAETEAGTNVGKDLQDSSLVEGAAGLLAMTSTADRTRDLQVRELLILLSFEVMRCHDW